MSDSPIKFPSSPSSSGDELPSHHSSKENVSSNNRMSDYSPPWSSKKEDLEKEDEDEDNANANAEDNDRDYDDNSDDSDFDFDSDFTSPPPKRPNFDCGFFKWHDPQYGKFLRTLILDLRNKIWELKAETNVTTNEEHLQEEEEIMP
ncbi:histone H2A.Z-specific chaperone CHZ1-like [Miscanthus floridulus]|uniref:histone H2A.Z-specific chaperone CHZ1-like n=1 Tax=Miscanthus floridulus TaxID=154761 RepID=UPI0034573EA1